ncbi:MAG: 4Fe-4S dicluster domain-containing protein [Pseudomonadota bacterium]
MGQSPSTNVEKEMAVYGYDGVVKSHCRMCEAACKQEFNTPHGVRLIVVSEKGPEMVGDKLDVVFHVNVCQHCDDPACADACPEGAVTRREDGIVVMDDALCTGCRLCVDACPYEAVAFDEDRGIARKCNLCHHRVDRGLLPACADNVCLARCILFRESEG